MRRVLGLVALVLLAPRAAYSACTGIYGTGLAFGTYTGQTVQNSAATVTIQCTANFGYSVGLNQGSTSGGTVLIRKMNAQSTLSYTLSQNSGYSINWGNTKGVDAEAGTTGGTAGQTFLTLYGKVTAAQYPTPGSYTDTITATLENSGNMTGQFSVTAQVLPTCTISATLLAFGTYTGARSQSTATLTVQCTNTTPYNIGLSAGNGGASVTTRAMTGPSNAKLPYALYRDSGHTLNWGVTVSTDTRAGTGTGSPQSIPVYGQIAAGSASAGSYSDLITATLTY